jgi:hypothetical protein
VRWAGAALAEVGRALGAAIPFGRRLPAGVLAAAPRPTSPGGLPGPVLRVDGKAALVLLGEGEAAGPETPETLLSDG